MAKADPGGQGGAETQLAEVTRIKGSCKCQFCTVEHAESAGLVAFETLWDHRYH